MHAEKEKHIHIVSVHGNRKVDIKHLIILGQDMRKECEWVRELESGIKQGCALHRPDLIMGSQPNGVIKRAFCT